MGVGNRGAEAPQFFVDLTVKGLVSMTKVGNRSDFHPHTSQTEY